MPALPAVPDEVPPTSPGDLQRILIDQLLLDPQNPRLPETTRAAGNAQASQPKLVEYFAKHGVLDELAASFADNGYFATEPLIVTREGAPKDRFIVLEGNRRLAALKVLFEGTAEQRDLLGVDLDKARRKELKAVPVLLVERHEDATAMIGFRHIGGLKFWDADAKARWIKKHVDGEAGRKPRSGDPIEVVSRQVGLPASAVRNYYLAWALVEFARKEEKYDPSRLIDEDRFGVWLRAIESPKIREYVGLGSPRTYDEAVKASKGGNSRRVVEVLADLTRTADGQPALVGDSRNITKYAAVIADAGARKVLRSRLDLLRAYETLVPVTLLEQIRRATRALKRLRDELDRLDDIEPEAKEAIDELRRVADSIGKRAKA
jgi:hypothetical protein